MRAVTPSPSVRVSRITSRRMMARTPLTRRMMTTLSMVLIIRVMIRRMTTV